MENNCSKESIREMIFKNENIQSFISNPTWYIDVYFMGEPIRITKEDVGVKYYFHLPYSTDVDYSRIGAFMEVCVEIISELLEENRKHNLIN